MIYGGILGFRVFEGGFEYFGPENMMIRSFAGAFPRPILGENGAKSAVAVKFGPCARAILDVFQWYWVMFDGVLGWFGVFWS